MEPTKLQNSTNRSKYLKFLISTNYRYFRFDRDLQSLYRLFKVNLSQLFTFNKNYDLKNTILIEGIGRSGTTWLGETLSLYLNYRLIAEPFHANNGFEIINKFIYQDDKNFKKILKFIPPNYDNIIFFKIFRSVFSGELKNHWTNRINQIIKSNGRVIKSIRASLFLKWIRNNFSDLPIIHIIRHPCAVVLSRVNRLAFKECLELNHILKQKALIKAYLEPYLNIINNADTFIKKNACLWCIQNLIPLRTMEDNEWLITTYERLFLNLRSEFGRILKYINPDLNLKNYKIKNLISMQTYQNSAIIKRKNPLKAWQEKLSNDQINEILEIVESFSLDDIYNKNFLPKKYFL